jgi:hypothetical protein
LTITARIPRRRIRTASRSVSSAQRTACFTHGRGEVVQTGSLGDPRVSAPVRANSSLSGPR